MRFRSAWLTSSSLVALLGTLAGAGCQSTAKPPTTPAELSSLRASGDASTNGEVVGQWLIGELVAKGGTTEGAARAKKRLDTLKSVGLYASLGRALEAEIHGTPRAAAEAFIAVLKAGQEDDDPIVPLAAWYATHHLLALRPAVHDLYAQNKATLDALTRAPHRLGWRAATELVEWSVAEALDKAELVGDAYDALVVEKSGCAKGVRLAGPFGHGTSVDRRRSFDPETPGPWPVAWAPDPMRGNVPHVLKSEQPRCLVSSTEHGDDGVFYAEGFFTTTEARALVLAVTGAVKVWVDDVPVLERSLNDWGAWQRFGVSLSLGAGRHRVVARLVDDATTIRILNPDGAPAGVATSTYSPAASYVSAPPTVLADPNPIQHIVEARTASSPVEALLAASAAHTDGLDDVAAVLLERLVAPPASPKDADPAGVLALEQAGGFAESDPALPDEVRQRTQKDLFTRALKKDPGLWYAHAWLILNDADQSGLEGAATPLKALAASVPNQPEVLEQLARLYSRLGWRSERMLALEELANRFPDDGAALRAYAAALDEDGPRAQADAVAARIRALDPDAEIDLDRALARHDWKGAIAELERLGKRRPDRKEIAARIASVLARAGDPSAAAAQLAKALAKNPEDSVARFRLADHALATGDLGALRKALADALQAGAKTAELRAAIDLVEGATNLEPYRVDGRKVIREFEAWEKTGKRMEGTSARILDYSAIWVHSDGSSEMLEHEIQRIQSQEAVSKESEQQPPTGLTLRVRVWKPDGSMLEPEPVAGKPTLSMPHLEVGDYLEIEHITPTAGDGQKGRRYRGPTWFFREADKGYWRSEFVTITPKDRELAIETRGSVAPPTSKDLGLFVERRWRVSESPPAPEEPESAPIQEYLPSVRIGWGISLADTATRLVDLATDETPLDPRLRARALEVVHGIPADDTDAQAAAIYKDVIEHVQDGEENDGRKVLFGKSGSRQAAFQHLIRQLGIPIESALVKSRLAMPPIGPMTEVENYDRVVQRMTTNRGVRWLTVRDKFAPYGYVPAEARGQAAIRLVAGTPKDTVSNGGAVDGIALEGRADLRADGSASMDLVQRYSGKVGIQMRNVFDKVPEGQVRDFVETRILAGNVPGARVRELTIEGEHDLSAPLVVRTKLEVPELARPRGDRFVLQSLFPMHLRQLAPLPERQTPMLLPAWSHLDVKITVVAPESLRMPASLPGGVVRDGERTATVRDAVQGHALVLDRTIDIPAGRVQPDAYPQFLRFVADADALLERDVVLGK